MRDALKRLMLVWAALLGLLAATVAAVFVPLGPVMPVVSYGIAFAKTALVFWFFMEMRREPGLVRLAATAGIIWLSFLLILIAADVTSRGWAGS